MLDRNRLLHWLYDIPGRSNQLFDAPSSEDKGPEKVAEPSTPTEFEEVPGHQGTVNFSPDAQSAGTSDSVIPVPATGNSGQTIDSNTTAAGDGPETSDRSLLNVPDTDGEQQQSFGGYSFKARADFDHQAQRYYYRLDETDAPAETSADVSEYESTASDTLSESSYAQNIGQTQAATITNTSTYPFNSIVLLETVFDSTPGFFSVGTGVVIGPNTILTASHNIYNSEFNDTVDDLYVYLGFSGTTPNPSGSGSPTINNVGWSVNGFAVGEPDGININISDVDQDYAVINVSHTFTSWFGLDWGYSGGSAHITGYPSSYGGTQVDQTGTVSQHSTYDIWLHGAGFNVESGNSGGPVWYDGDPGPGYDPYVVGIVSTGSWSMRLNQTVIDQINAWVTAAGYDPITGNDPGDPGTNGPDLRATVHGVNTEAVAYINTPIPYVTDGYFGGPLRVHYTIHNDGDEATPWSFQVYLSTNSTITQSDTLISSLTQGLSTIGPNSSFGPEWTGYLHITLPDDIPEGTYYIGIIADPNSTIAETNENNNSSNAIQITIETFDDFGQTAGDAGTISLNSSRTGNLEEGGDIDWFAVTLVAGYTYVFSLEGSPTGQGTLADPFLRLFNASSTQVAFNDDGGTGLNSLLVYTPSSSGVFYLSAAAFSASQTGTYTLSADTLLSNNSDNVTLPSTGGPWHALNGNDTVTGTSSGETIYGDDGNDIIYGMGGNDTLVGGDDDDMIDGGPGNDTIVAGSGHGNDDYDGGANTDTITYASTSQGITVNLLTGTASGTEIGNDTLSNIENIISGSGNDHLTGDAANNAIDGGLGDDTLYYISTTLGISINLLSGFATGTEIGVDTVSNIENIITGSGQDAITGNNVANVLSGGGERDTIFGRGGNDTINGEEGNDALFGQDGQDTLNGGIGNDVLFGGNDADILNGGDDNDVLRGEDGNDTLNGDAGDDTILGDPGSDSLNGGDDVDTANYVLSTSAVTVNLLTGTGSGGYAQGDTLSGIERLRGSFHNDFLTGDNADNLIQGLPGGDTIFGLGGNDLVFGGPGNDTINGGDGVDALFGQAGVDVINGGNERDVIFGGAEGDTLNGDDGNDVLLGEAGNDTLNGGEGHDSLLGGPGGDVLNGGNGFDLANYVLSSLGVNVSLATGTGSGGDAQGDTLISIENLRGSNHADTLTGDDGSNQIRGLAGNDIIFGNGGVDVLFGNDGEDTLNGGSGTDFLNGGNDDDLYIIQNGTGIDHLVGFQAGAGSDDVADISDFSFADFNAVLSAAFDVGSDVHIQLDANDLLIIQGVQESQLHPDDFLISG